MVVVAAEPGTAADSADPAESSSSRPELGLLGLYFGRTMGIEELEVAYSWESRCMCMNWLVHQYNSTDAVG